MDHGSDSFQIFFETIDPSILNPLEIHKRSEKFPKLPEGGR